MVKIQNFSQIRFNDLVLLVKFADTVSSFVNILLQFGFSKDLFSSSKLDIAISKLPLDTQRRWFAFIESPAKVMRAPNLIQFNERLSEESHIHERLLSSGPTISKLNTPSSKSGKRFDFKKNLKSGESALSSITDKDRIDSICPLCNADHRILELREVQEYENARSIRHCKGKEIVFCLYVQQSSSNGLSKKKEMWN